MWRNRYNKVGVPSYDNRANMPRGPPNFPHGDNHPLNKNFVMHDSEVDVPGVRNSRMEYYDNWNPPMPGSLPQPGCFYGGSEPGPGPPPQSIADNLYPRIGVVLPSTGTLALPTRRGASVPECQIVVFRGASR